jgi:hypothetical protein
MSSVTVLTAAAAAVTVLVAVPHGSSIQQCDLTV